VSGEGWVGLHGWIMLIDKLREARKTIYGLMLKAMLRKRFQRHFSASGGYEGCRGHEFFKMTKQQVGKCESAKKCRSVIFP
jgi:hypothetical protein